MKILVIGTGGREHAICHALAASKKVRKLYAAPGNSGTALIAQNVDILPTDIKELIAFARNVNIDLTICPMEEPLVMGIVDAFEEAGLKVFGPNKAAALIEGSKAFAKDFAIKYGVPTAKYGVFDSFTDAMGYCLESPFPLVVKVDGLAAGKGVTICFNMESAERALKQIFDDKRFGASGEKVVIEEFLLGAECSVLAFCDGQSIVPMPGAMDYKPAFDNDMGPNTGGMGAITPNPHYTDEMAKRCMEEIFLPTVNGMIKEGREFVGILYFGLMLTANGPKLIEYNCRPGDPETQVILPLLQTDLIDIVNACMDKNLDKLEIKWKNNAMCCVVLASGGYPGSYVTGHAISGIEDFGSDVSVYHAGAIRDSENVITNGGRVLCVCGSGSDSEIARNRAYGALAGIRFKDMHYRRDIGIMQEPGKGMK